MFGAFGQPTNINNVETLCAVPHIIRNGAEWFAGIGVVGAFTLVLAFAAVFAVVGYVVIRRATPR